MTWGTITGGPIDLFTWGMMYPYNYTTNYGGQYQYNLMPSCLTPNQAFNIQNLFNPTFQISQMMNRFWSFFNPWQNMQQSFLAQSAYVQGNAMGVNIVNNSAAQSLASNISSLKSQLNQAAESDKVKDEDKKQLKALLKELEKLEKRFENLALLQKQGATGEQFKAGLDAIRNDFNKIKEQAQKLAEKIAAYVKEAEEVEETDKTDETEDDTDGTVEIDGDGTVFETQSTDETSYLRDICDTINDAVKGLGTDEEKLELAMAAINGNNVIEVFAQWNTTYGQYKPYKSDKDCLIETLMDDCEGKEKEKIGTYIVDALEARADALGINLDNEITGARMALKGNWLGWHNDDAIQERVNDIVAKIAAYETQAAE